MSEATRYPSLVALAEAWPFRGPSGFETGLIALDRPPPGDRDSATAKLSAGFEQEAQTLARGQSLASLEALREHHWFPPGQPRPRLTQLLTRLAVLHLRWTGDAIRLAEVSAAELAAQTMRWRWLSLQLPQDLLIAALAVHEDVEPCTDRVQLVDPTLEPVLDQPVAETHLHLGAALDFGELWSALLEDATRPQFGAKLKTAPTPFISPAGYRRALVSAAIVRQLLAAYLWHRELLGLHAQPSFGRFLAHELAAIAQRTGSSRAARVELASHAALTELLGPSSPTDGQDLGVSSFELIRAYHLLWGPQHRIDRLDQLLDADPVSHWLTRQPGHARPETRLIARALCHIDISEPDELFETAIWQYLRVRNLVFGHLVERPGTAGLGWFTRHFDRLRAHRGRLRAHELEACLRLQSPGLHLASLEVRTAPKTRWYELGAEIQSLASQALAFAPPLGRQRPEIGLVLHFIKGRREPGDYYLRCRHGRWYYDAQLQAQAIARALRLDPRRLLVLRGLDVAADELEIPTWVLTPLFAIVRHAARNAAATLAPARSSWGVRPLRTTLHLGEEFHRLIQGLRRVHEAVETGLLDQGDRIGHGLALGWPIEAWVRQHPRTLQAREERLFDLLWELERYRAGDLSPPPGRETLIGAELEALGAAMFDDRIPVFELLELRRSLFNPAALVHQFHFPFGPRGPARGPTSLTHRYLLDPAVRDQARRPIEVVASESETELIERARRWVLDQLANLGVTIEVNPTSNLLIGDLANLGEHPCFRLAPLEEGARPRLEVSINSDDPLTFASSLADEYAYMKAAIVSQGHPTARAHAWLEAARDSGWTSRFTLQASSNPAHLQELLPPRRVPRPDE